MANSKYIETEDIPLLLHSYLFQSSVAHPLLFPMHQYPLLPILRSNYNVKACNIYIYSPEVLKEVLDPYTKFVIPHNFSNEALRLEALSSDSFNLN